VAPLSARIESRSWKVTILPLPRGLTFARALCFGAGGILGVAEARRQSPRRCLWVEGQGEPIKEPKGFEPWGACGRQLVGRLPVNTKDHAVLCERQDARRAPVDLHPPRYASSVATGCADGQQVGYGVPAGQTAPSPIERALLWSGTPDGVIELRGPEPGRQTHALAVRDGVQVGEYGRNWSRHAAMWRSSSASMTDLHPAPPKGYPPDVQVSTAEGVADGQQVGVVGWKKTQLASQVARAALWTDSAASFIDLTPRAFKNAWAYACARGLQVGWATRSASVGQNRAILWNGSAKDYIALQDLVPAPWNRSFARDISVEGTALRILGTVSQMSKDSANEVLRAEQIAVWEAVLAT
jgi:hypothetical protein